LARFRVTIAAEGCVGLSAALSSEVVAFDAAGVMLAIVGFEYRHRFGVGQVGMGLAEAAECLLVEVG
jgi:hypothetical protein